MLILASFSLSLCHVSVHSKISTINNILKICNRKQQQQKSGIYEVNLQVSHKHQSIKENTCILQLKIITCKNEKSKFAQPLMQIDRIFILLHNLIHLNLIFNFLIFFIHLLHINQACILHKYLSAIWFLIKCLSSNFDLPFCYCCILLCNGW